MSRFHLLLQGFRSNLSQNGRCLLSSLLFLSHPSHPLSSFQFLLSSSRLVLRHCLLFVLPGFLPPYPGSKLSSCHPPDEFSTARARMCFTYPGLSTLQGGVATVHAGGLQGSAVRRSRFGDDVWSWAGWVTGVTTPRDLGGLPA